MGGDSFAGKDPQWIVKPDRKKKKKYIERYFPNRVQYSTEINNLKLCVVLYYCLLNCYKLHLGGTLLLK